MDSTKEAKIGVSWHRLQELLRECTTEQQVQELIDEERKNFKRPRFLQRMQGRFRVLRQEREERELNAFADSAGK